MSYREATPIQRFMGWSAATAPMSWLYARVLHHLDRLSYRLTRGRHTLASWLSGLPVVLLTTTGAKTGQQRTSPVLGVPEGDDLVVIASNWGPAPASRLVPRPARPSQRRGHGGRCPPARPGP